MQSKVAIPTLIFALMLVMGGAAVAEDMSGAELRVLLGGGLTLTLGGPEEGYTGELRLEPDGTGVGAASLDSGRELDISGTWVIEGHQFCREWKFSDYKKVCETWRKLSDGKVEVIVDGKRVGVNSW